MSQSVKTTKNRAKVDLGRAKQIAAAKRREQMLVLGVAVGAVVLFIIVILLVTGSNQQVVQGQYTAVPQAAMSSGAPILGSSAAKVTLMEFADFSCPHCLAYKPTMAEVIDTYVRTGKARLIFQPMTFVSQEVNQNWSALAAIAAVCANKQNAFWEMNDALYALQSTSGAASFDVAHFTQISDKLKLDTNALLDCYRKQEPAQVIVDAQKLYTQYKLDGVPGLLYSTDGGNTFQYFKDSSGTANSRPTIDLIRAVLDPLVK